MMKFGCVLFFLVCVWFFSLKLIHAMVLWTTLKKSGHFLRTFGYIVKGFELGCSEALGMVTGKITLFPSVIFWFDLTSSNILHFTFHTKNKVGENSSSHCEWLANVVWIYDLFSR